MNGVPSSDVGREARGRQRSDSGRSVDYVRDGAVAAHKKNLSGNLLSKLGFGHTSPEPLPKSGPSHKDSVGVTVHDAAAAGRAAMSMPMSAAFVTRSRKGSLRKNILRKGSIQRMETILSPRVETRMTSYTDSTEGSSVLSSMSEEGADVDDDDATPRASYDGAGSPTGRRGLGLTGLNRNTEGQGGSHSDGAIPSTSLRQSSNTRDPSTTDEDERPSSSSNASSSGITMPMTKRPTVVTNSYFPPSPQPAAATATTRRHSPFEVPRTTTKSSPLSALPLDTTTAAPLSTEVWDYAETEWWGWIILFVTWVTFVVGMGSCFGVWSWAWDVGETPYAPPELEDDPTLPIVGYYPALIVLTGVMAWVWVIIAWVGLKYFKHAKMGGEDG